MKRPLLVLPCVFLLFLHTVTLAQQIVKDINPAPGTLVTVLNNATQRCFTCGALVYFVAGDSAGKELWKTDGTSEGTQRVIDLNPGAGDGMAESARVTCFNGNAYFRAWDGRIYKTDGTPAGTIAITGVTGPYDPEIFDNKLYYVGLQTEIWSTTGESGTEQLVKSFNDYGPDRYVGIVGLASGDTRLYFTLVVYGTMGSEGAELWKTDGTEGGTERVKAFDVAGKYPYSIIAGGDMVFFDGMDDAHGLEPWVSDGTEAGTQMLVDTNAGPADGNMFVHTIYEGKLIFVAGGTTWVSDGTPLGTEVIISGLNVSATRPYNGSLYLIGSNSQGWKLYKSDGTAGGTTELNALGMDVFYPVSLPVVNNTLVFPFEGVGTGVELGFSAGGAGDAALLKDISPGTASSSPRFFAELGGQIIFMADDGEAGFELWTTDGTPSGTALVKDIRPGTESANLGSMEVVGDKLYFLSGSNAHFRDLWTSDGTAAGTSMVYDFQGPHIFGKTAQHLIILDDFKIWGSNGTQAGTSVIFDIRTIGGSLGYNSYKGIAAGDNLFFQLGVNSTPYNLWRANAVTGEANAVENADAGVSSSFTTLDFRGAGLGDELVFAMQDAAHGEELWITHDGGLNKELLKDINAGVGNADLCCFASAGQKVFFVANDVTHGSELWVTDGTPAGTVIVRDVSPGTASGWSAGPAILNGKAVFSANGPEGIEAWISDGTQAGTVLLKDIREGNSSPVGFTTLKGNVYFSAEDAEAGRELFVTDGTTDGTRVIDVKPGISGSDPEKILAAGGVIYFTSGPYVWRTLGTTEATEAVGDFDRLSDLYGIPGYVLYEAQDPLLGRELFALEVTNFEQTLTLSPVGPKMVGDPPFRVDVFSSSLLPVTLVSGDDNISISGLEVEILGAGEVTITATQPGDENSNAAEPVSETFCVHPQKPVITVDYTDESAILTSNIPENNHWYRNGVLVSTADNDLEVSEDGIYTLIISVEGCESESSEQALIYTGTEDAHSGVKLFPNPATDYLRLHVPPSPNGARLIIRDLAGRMIVDVTAMGTSDELPVSGLKQGIYLMEVITGNKRSYHRFEKL